VGYKDGKLD